MIEWQLKSKKKTPKQLYPLFSFGWDFYAKETMCDGICERANAYIGVSCTMCVRRLRLCAVSKRWHAGNGKKSENAWVTTRARERPNAPVCQLNVNLNARQKRFLWIWTTFPSKCTYHPFHSQIEMRLMAKSMNIHIYSSMFTWIFAKWIMQFWLYPMQPNDSQCESMWSGLKVNRARTCQTISSYWHKNWEMSIRTHAFEYI